MPQCLELLVKTGQSGERLDRLVMATATVSRRVARLWIAQGRVQVNGRVVRIVSRPIDSGARIRVEPEPQASRGSEAGHAPVTVLHLDAWMIAVAKPAGLLSESDRQGSPSLESEVPHLLARAGERKTRVFLAHRLDAGTSGVLVLARTPMAAKALGDTFAQGRAEKQYLALCAGALVEPQTVDAPIGRQAGVRHMIDASGRPALTHVVPLAHQGRASLVRALPKTGRTHQIRVHLASLGHPLLGDRLYGGPGYTDDEPPLPIGRPMLHAERLVLPHPKHGTPLELCTPPPDDFVGLASRLGLWR